MTLRLRRVLWLPSLGLAALAALAGLWRGRGEGRAPGPGDGPPPVPEIARAVAAAPPVILVGLDGADWELLDRFVAAGAMPNLAGLLGEGTGGVLETLHPPLSPLVWTTMMTGIGPLEHGILDFTRFNRSSGKKEPITSDERREPAVWNMATYAGRSVAALGLWATYPAEPVRGLLVSDRLFSFLYKEENPPPGVVYPARREAWARDALQRAETETGLAAVRSYLPWLDAGEYADRLETGDPYAHPVSALRRILIETRVYHELATSWIETEKPDVAIVYLQGTDSIGHVFAPFAPPRQASISEADYERYGRVPELYFRYVDRLLGDYRGLAQTRGGILVLASDHGFTWSEGRPTQLSSFALATAGRWHRKDGMYLLWGRGIKASPGRPHRGKVEQLCATLLALSGLPEAGYMAGPPLPGTPERRRGRVDYRAYYKPSSLSLSAASSGADEESLAKLRALGYVGAGESMAAPEAARGGTRTAGSYNNEGLLLKDQDRIEEAIGAFEKGLELDPNLASALWNLSDLLHERGREADRSDGLLVKALAHGLPEGTKFLFGRAIAYQRDGQLARSVKLMHAAAAARPDDPEVWLFSGRYLIEAARCQEAIEAFRKAVRLAPDNAAAHASEGLAHLCVGDQAAAKGSFRRSLALDPDQPKVRDYLESL